MRWRTGRRSSNIEDRRGVRLSRKAKGGGIGVLLIALVAMYFGIDPSFILQQNAEISIIYVEQTAYVPTAAENELADFVSVVLADTEDTWDTIFREGGGQYEQPKLVLFTGAVESACGFAQAAMPVPLGGQSHSNGQLPESCSVSAPIGTSFWQVL